MTASRSGLLLLLLPGVGYLVLFFGLPLALSFATSLGLGGIGFTTSGTVANGGPTLANYITLVTDSVYRDAIAQTVWIAVAPTLVSLAVALPLAVTLRATFPGRTLFLTLYKIPLVVPGIVAAFIVMILFDRGGEISRILKPLGLSLPKLVRDDWSIGVIIALAWKSIPFMTVIIGGALAAIPADLAPAARSLGAGRTQVFWRIELPLALPGISAATLLVFIGSVGAFAVPSLLGSIYPKPLSVWMYEAAYTKNDWGLAAAMGIVISAIACLVLVAYYRATAGLRHAAGGETR